jgi:hypothetical protein
MKKLGLLSVIAALLLIGFATTNCNKKPDKAPQLDTMGLNLPTTTGGTTSSTSGYKKFGDLDVTTYNDNKQTISGVVVFLAGDLDSAKQHKVYTYGGVTYQDTSGSSGSGTTATLKFVPIRSKDFYIGAYKVNTASDTLHGVPKSFNAVAKYAGTSRNMSDSIAVR